MIKTDEYCITKENFMVHEIIGLKVEVIGSNDKNKINLKGKIIDETKNLFVLETEKGEKKIPKKEVLLRFEIGKENVKIDGKLLVARPEDRTKLLKGVSI